MKVRHPSSILGGESPISSNPSLQKYGSWAILCASLAKGKSVVRNIAYSDDILATIAGMRQLGASIETLEDSVVVEGVGDHRQVESMTVDCNESGSTLRFFIPVFTLSGKPMTFVGRNRLLKRPQGVYESLYQERGLGFIQTPDAITVEGSLTAGRYEIDGNISSQFISGLLFALPLLDGDSIIVIRPPFESRSYIELTFQGAGSIWRACFFCG